ncbi:DUF3558 family protein [Virgisporangium aurantiacum]|uniref:DUF3558 domain-containing protein n=1 Tax=Virgisporangium aurantiacum TaxID=175570 RepID=A0A8J3Z4C3_9ACTN|nr:DUF3558 family protein [Virgisporangium aurantiacum]GIJ57074.1 hypothetical protein Vau01_045900 [Virgisporangium aurantiacum]
MHRWIRPAVVVLSTVVVTACGGSTEPAGKAADPAEGTPSASAPDSPISRFATPTDACAVLPADVAATLKVVKNRRTGSSLLGCTWELDTGDKYKSRSIGVEYEAWDDVPGAKTRFDTKKRSDTARGRGVNVTIGETGEVRQIGTQQQDRNYDEAYYFYGSAEIAGLTLGNGTVVIRRGNVIVDISAQGNDVLPPYTGKLRSNPLASAEAKDMIDRTADVLAGAVKPG